MAAPQRRRGVAIAVQPGVVSRYDKPRRALASDTHDKVVARGRPLCDKSHVSRSSVLAVPRPPSSSSGHSPCRKVDDELRARLFTVSYRARPPGNDLEAALGPIDSWTTSLARCELSIGCPVLTEEAAVAEASDSRAICSSSFLAPASAASKISVRLSLLAECSPPL